MFLGFCIATKICWATCPKMSDPTDRVAQESRKKNPPKVKTSKPNCRICATEREKIVCFHYNKMILDDMSLLSYIFCFFWCFYSFIYCCFVFFICEAEVKILVSSAHISLKIIVLNVSLTFESKHCPWNFLPWVWQQTSQKPHCVLEHVYVKCTFFFYGLGVMEMIPSQHEGINLNSWVVKHFPSSSLPQLMA